MIEIVVQMFGFQRRLHWMLSGLAQQEAAEEHPVPPLRVRIDTHVDDPYREHNAALRSIFGGLLNIQWVEHADAAFMSRGLLRDKDLQESEADWLIFSDADMVYPPHFLAQLALGYLDTGQHNDALLAICRNSPARNAVDAVIETADYSAPIPDAFAKASALWSVADGRSSAPIGVGYFQMVRRTEALKRGTYCQNARPHDRPIGKKFGGRSGSDCQFRSGWRIVKIDLPPLLHLRHARNWKGEWKGGIR